VHPAVGDALATLAATPHTTVVIFSASSRDRLGEAFEGLPVWLAAENGVFIRPPLPEQVMCYYCPRPRGKAVRVLMEGDHRSGGLEGWRGWEGESANERTVEQFEKLRALTDRKSVV
jgi:trehalose-6-phosphatase